MLRRIVSAAVRERASRLFIHRVVVLTSMQGPENAAVPAAEQQKRAQTHPDYKYWGESLGPS